LVVYNLKTDQKDKVLWTGLNPFNMVSSPDAKTIYITNYTSDSISVFNTHSNQMMDSIILE